MATNLIGMTTNALTDYINARYDDLASGRIHSAEGFVNKVIEPAIAILNRKCHTLGKPVPRLGTTNELFGDCYDCAGCGKPVVHTADDHWFTDGKPACKPCYDAYWGD